MQSWKQPTISKDILAFYDKITSSNIPLTDTNQLLGFAKGLNITNESFLDFLSNTENADKSLDAYKKQVQNASGGNAAFAASLKSMAANIGIMLAVTLAIKGAMMIFDEINVTFKEQQEIVDDLKTKIADLKSEYDQLSADPSASGEKLDYLKRQIDLQERLLKIEERQLALKDMNQEMPSTADD